MKLTAPHNSQPDIEQEHETIWLQPWCDGCEKNDHGFNGRQWCEDDVWEDCSECGRKSVSYTLSRPHHSAPEKQPRATIDELERGLAAIIGSDAAHLIRRMIDARELIGTAWEEDVPSPQDTEQ